jgi:hypothetical protein
VTCSVADDRFFTLDGATQTKQGVGLPTRTFTWASTSELPGCGVTNKECGTQWRIVLLEY